MTESKKKPVRLEIDRGILDSAPHGSEAVPVPIKGSGGSGGGGGGSKARAHQGNSSKKGAGAAVPPPAAGYAPPAAGYDLRVRFEKKGRGGQPVFVLFAVLPGSLARIGISDLDTLGRRLKTTLSCGGTVADSEIILQCRDRARLDDVLARLGLRAQ